MTRLTRIFLVLLTLVTSFVSQAELGKSGDVTIIVTDRFGRSIANAEVTFGLDQLLTSDKEGKVTVEDVDWGSSYQINVIATGYRDYFGFHEVDKKRNSITIKLGWTKERWAAYTKQFRLEEIMRRDSVIVTTDLSKYGDCSNVDTDHFWFDAQFPGGQKEMGRYVSDMIDYPESSIDYGEQGKVYVSFVIQQDGSVAEVRVMRGVSASLDREAKRVIREMPTWIPASCNGKTVSVRCTLPIVFTLN
ncbi:MAG: TonB family protein [bacterium]|nr:TonB family protein [bacterium]